MTGRYKDIVWVDNAGNEIDAMWMVEVLSALINWKGESVRSKEMTPLLITFKSTLFSKEKMEGVVKAVVVYCWFPVGIIIKFL
jgi:hypothetical protein